MPLFYIAQFDSDESVEIIPESWLDKSGEEEYSYWAGTGDKRKLLNLIMKNVIPEKTWLKYKLKRIFAEAGTNLDLYIKYDNCYNLLET